MRLHRNRNRLISLAACFAVLLSLCLPSLAQTKTLYRDHDGNLISNNEFVDIRMANFHYKDATIVNTLEDGTVEFRLQKIPQEGMAAPDFLVKTVGGETFSLAGLKGKVVVLNFWFIGCAICRAHKPKLNDLKAKFENEEKVVFIAMAPDPLGEVKNYLAREPFDYIQIADAQAQLKTFRFSGYPKNIVINKAGEIIYWRSGVSAWDKFESLIRTELEKD